MRGPVLAAQPTSPFQGLCAFYLSHYAAAVALVTLQRNNCAVYLSRSVASPNSFANLSPFDFFAFFLSLQKTGNSPHFAIPLLSI